MMSNILKRHKGLKVQLTQNKLITGYDRVQVPGISPAIKPDVSITNTEDDKIVFIEVLSETLVKTYHLMFFAVGPCHILTPMHLVSLHYDKNAVILCHNHLS